MLIPLVLLLASLVSSCFSYSRAKQDFTDDLNRGMISFVNENSELWTRRDTIAALRHLHEAIHTPAIYRAYGVEFKNATLRKDAYFTLALVDINSALAETPASVNNSGNSISSDSIMLMPENASEGVAVKVQGFATCSIASVLAASDQTVPSILFTLSLMSMGAMVALRRRESDNAETLVQTTEMPSISELKLTPMQRQFTQMLLDAPGMRVDKATLCVTLWGNKSNAEESLYTLVRRTKAALADTNIEIICNRGVSYELRINNCASTNVSICQINIRHFLQFI